MRYVELAMYSLRKYADFSGRASREEFWTFVAFVLFANLVAQLLGAMLGLGYAFAGLVSLLLFFPQLAVAVRRLHDVGRRGRELLVPGGLMALVSLLFLFRGLLPRMIALGVLGLALLGFASLLTLFLKKGSSVPNKYGASPGAFSFAKQGAN